MANNAPPASLDSVALARFDATDDPALVAVALDGVQPRRTASHGHRRGQLYALSRGLLWVESGAGRWVMPAGCVGWIPPGMRHAALGGGPVSGWSAYLAPALCARLPAEPCVLGASALVAPIVERAVAWTRRAAAGQALAPTQQRLLAVLIDELTQAPRDMLHLPFPTDRRLLRIARALADDPADTRPLAAWADGAGLSVRSLTRHFQAETGLSFMRWRQRARLLRALERLAAGEPVGVVADALGYQSPSTFAAVFRAQFGRPPSRYFDATAGQRAGRVSRSAATSSRST